MVSLTILVVCALIAGGEFASVRHLGLPSGEDRTRIINGEAAGNGEIPHQLELLRFGLQICGASIISNNWALTAAHCVEGIFSTAFIQVRGHTPMSFTTQVTEIIMHEDYGVGDAAFPNDVALLRLNDPVTDISSNIIEVASDPLLLFDGYLCEISGYGVTETGSASTNLMRTDVTVLTKEECKGFFEPDGSTDYVQDQHICVMGQIHPGSGACNGDSGGPLTCYIAGSPLLVGVTSWGMTGCHNEGVVEFPSVYARTSQFYDWIKTNCGNCI